MLVHLIIYLDKPGDFGFDFNNAKICQYSGTVNKKEQHFQNNEPEITGL